MADLTGYMDGVIDCRIVKDCRERYSAEIERLIRVADERAVVNSSGPKGVRMIPKWIKDRYKNLPPGRKDKLMWHWKGDDHGQRVFPNG